MSSTASRESTYESQRTFQLALCHKDTRDLEARIVIRRRADPRACHTSVIALGATGSGARPELVAELEALYAQLESRLGRRRIDAQMTLLTKAEAEIGHDAGN